MINKNFLFGLFVLTFLQGCADTWLGATEQDILIEGDRIDVIPSSAFIVNPDEFLEEEIELNTSLILPSKLEKDWSVNVGKKGIMGLKSTPVFSENVVYVFDNRGYVVSLNARTGRKIWEVLVSRKKEDTTGIFGGGIAIGSKTIFVSTGYGDLFSLDKENGGMVWKYSSIAPFNSAPYVKDEIVLAVNRENETIALEETSGEILWKQKGTPEEASMLSNLQIVGNSRIVIPTYTSGEVFALIPQNGREVWSDALGLIYKNETINAISDISASSVISGDVLIATGLDNQIVAINLQSGNRIWQRKIKATKTPRVIDDYLFVLTKDKELIAMSAINGGVYWKTPLAEELEWSNMAIYKNNIVLNNSANDVLFFSARNGELSFEQDVSSYSNSAPIFSDNHMYLLGTSGKLKAYLLD